MTRYSCRAIGFLPGASMESTTLGSRRMFFTFCQTPMWPTTNSSFSIPTHTTVTCGLPSVLRVIKCALGPVAIRSRTDCGICIAFSLSGLQPCRHYFRRFRGRTYGYDFKRIETLPGFRPHEKIGIISTHELKARMKFQTHPTRHVLQSFGKHAALLTSTAVDLRGRAGVEVFNQHVEHTQDP